MARSLETVLLSSREVLVIKDRASIEIFEDSAFRRHSMIITMLVNRDEEDKKLWL